MKRELEEKEYHMESIMEDENEIDLLEIFKKIWKNKKIIALIFLIGTFISLVGAKIYKKSTTVSRVGISFNFEELKQGKNPDGTPFNMAEIIPSKSIYTAYNKYKTLSDENLSITDFREFIKITPVIPKNISVLVEKNLKEGIFYSFTPTEYFINLKTELNNESEKELLEEIVKSVLNEYILNNRPLSVLSKLDIKQLETQELTYENYLEIINKTLEAIKNDIELSNNKKIKFSTVALNYDFKDILLELELIKSIGLNKIEAKLDLTYSSPNVEKSNAILNKKLTNLTIDKEVAIKKAKVIKETIDGYKISSKELILPDGMNANIPEKDDNYAKLINDYIVTTTQIEVNEQEIKKLQKKILSLSKSSDSEERLMINDIKTVINSINTEINKLNELNKKFYEAEYSNMITQITPVENLYTGKPIILFIAIGAFLSLVVGCLYALIKEIIQEKTQK